ncbi:PLP-dependent transferase [Dissoconium aciculare CBS 342.82]|uniref:alanine--glyoxylate transaminase n=1 Tax=Dissoconium aciculare CBS 342.82 TaxID=1314786 RepID=A0A6J3LRE4_9PEZI|nr:PLP-dependent transferase [Dissoconium aciculare CBS 342.82]KAF1818405.1 PLP-dependent transferase [Dissoconium aciculare CBS 342.82]
MTVTSKHATLLTPGPIETDDDVLLSMGHPSESHVGPSFARVFGETLTMLRRMLQTSNPDSQPFILAGSGTLGFDQVAANLLEPGDRALVLNCGYWGDAFAECLRIYRIEVDELQAPTVGSQPPVSDIERMLRATKYKAITITHTDTSTGVLSDVKSIAALVHTVSPDTLIIVDGVCSIGCEDLRFDEWQLDIVLGASQKALGAPAGLSIVMASSLAMQIFQQRQTPPGAYYASWKRWVPVMCSYESEPSPKYFATPPCHLIRALHVSLTKILSTSWEERLQQHEVASSKVKDAVADLGLEQICVEPSSQAHSMTAFWLPSGLRSENVLPFLARKGVILARGPQKEIAGQYIRFAHMGISATDSRRTDVDKGISALKEVLTDLRLG